MKTIEEILQEKKIIIKQSKEWMEIFTGFETKNKYKILNQNNEILGHIIEEGSGLMSLVRRFFLRSHRPFTFSVFDPDGNNILSFHRKFFWFFSDLYIETPLKKYGSIHRRFAFFSKNYTVHTPEGNELFSIKSPIWRLWTFPIYNKVDSKVGVITKKWQGFLKEVFTDADSFMIDFESDLITPEQKVLLFATGISIDFDFFDNNQGSSGLLDFLNN